MIPIEILTNILYKNGVGREDELFNDLKRLGWALFFLFLLFFFIGNKLLTGLITGELSATRKELWNSLPYFLALIVSHGSTPLKWVCSRETFLPFYGVDIPMAKLCLWWPHAYPGDRTMGIGIRAGYPIMSFLSLCLSFIFLWFRTRSELDL